MGSKPDRKERSKTILVVEDDDLIRSIVRIVLERLGYVLLEACDGADGLIVSRNFSGRIDLVVSDVKMPIMDGPEMVSRLQVERPGIKVLLISAYSTQSLPPELTKDFLPKPFLPAGIEQKVQEIFARDVASLGQAKRWLRSRPA